MKKQESNCRSFRAGGARDLHGRPLPDRQPARSLCPAHRLLREFTNLAGLSKGSKVQVAGMDAGQVLEIAVPSSPSGRFRIKLQIDEAPPRTCSQRFNRHHRNSRSGWGNISAHSPWKPECSSSKPLSLLPSKEPMDLANLLDQGRALSAI